MNEIKISETADNLIAKFGLSQHRWSEDGWEHRQNLRAYIAELEAKAERAKWKTGHPEHGRQVLVYLRFRPGEDEVLYYHINKWDQELGRWSAFPFKDGENYEFLGWRECDDFDLMVID